MGRDAKPLRLLIIDDFPAIVDRIWRLLYPSTFLEVVGSVKSIANVEESLSMFRPDLIIMDLHVGIGSTVNQGVEAIARIKEIAPHVKIVVFTNFADLRYRELSFSKGADMFLDKAFDSDKLVEIITSIYKNQLRSDDNE